VFKERKGLNTKRKLFYFDTCKVYNNFKNNCNYFKKKLKITHINTQSILANSKIEEISIICNETDIDILCITESWLKSNYNNNFFKQYMSNYQIIRKDRISKRGGGLIIFIKKNIKYKILEIENCGIIEILFIKLLDKNIVIGTCYRPPNSISDDLDFFENILTNLILNNDNLILLGDFNININNESSLQKKYLNIISNLNLNQIIDKNTHHLDFSESLIDHILVSNQENVIISDKCSFSGISHHDMIYIIYNSEVFKLKSKKIKIRNFNNLDQINSLQQSIYETPFEKIENITNCNDQILLFNKLFMETVNLNIPERTITIKSNKPKWLSNEIRNLQKERDFLRRRFINSKSNMALLSYKTIRNKCSRIIRDTKKKFIENSINLKNFNSKEVSKELKNLGIFKNKNSDYIFDKKNINDLNKFYQQVGNLKFLNDNDSVNVFLNSEVQEFSELFSFIDVDEIQIKYYLSTIITKAKGFDNISADLLKLTNNRILKYLTLIINNSLNSGIFPDCWKLANIIPIPKVNNPLDFSDLRPISILPTSSKLLEKTVHEQLNNYLNINNILPDEQSGFRRFFSTTTLLLQITSLIYDALNNNKVISLVLLDFSKAFDSINHDIMINNLKEIGLSKLSINWFNSYLRERKHRVIVDESFSDWLDVICGIPQGSILGPILFSIYTRKIPSIFNYVQCFMFADDTQLLKSYNVEDSKTCIDEINVDLNILSLWCEKNYLKLNPKKCIHLIIGSEKNLNKLNNNIDDLKINNIVIPRCKEARNLGLIFDEHFTWNSHINYLTKNCFSILKPLYRFKNQFNFNVKKLLINSLIISKFDYCDIIYMHLSENLQNKLQKLQNICIKFIFNLKKYDHINDYYNTLNWLKLNKRREYHLGCYIFKIINNKSPNYLFTLFNETSIIHSHNTRKRFFIPSIKTNNGKKSFKYFGPYIWNNIPNEIKNETNLYSFKNKYLNYIKTT